MDRDIATTPGQGFLTGRAGPGNHGHARNGPASYRSGRPKTRRATEILPRNAKFLSDIALAVRRHTLPGARSLRL
ncbi:hypothetical protein AA16373_1623 [Komagataeibacter swingsii DSM 16373]|nr:hypothetical protein AA16373_1623 [Komagataeibacter swingsii DSM 16373]